MVAHSFGYGDLGSGRQREREELKEEGDPQPLPDLQPLGEKALCSPQDTFPSQTCLSFSCPFHSLWPHRWQADLRHEASEMDRELYFGLQISFLYINKKTQNYPKMTLPAFYFPV